MHLDVNYEGQILWANQAVEMSGIVGYSGEELLGMSLYDMLGLKQDNTRLQNLLNSKRFYNKPFRVEKMLVDGKFKKREENHHLEISGNRSENGFEGWIVSVEDITGKVGLIEHYKQQSITDPLTGVYNRRYFFEKATETHKLARRHTRPLSVIMLDINDFKLYNDNHGHTIGDQVLIAMAKDLNSNTRDIDLLGRYGGDEFVILLPEMAEHEALLMAERLRTYVARQLYSDFNLPISISLGVAQLIPSDNKIEDLVNRADQALYATKRAGKKETKVWIPKHVTLLQGN